MLGDALKPEHVGQLLNAIEHAAPIYRFYKSHLSFSASSHLARFLSAAFALKGAVLSVAEEREFRNWAVDHMDDDPSFVERVRARLATTPTWAEHWQRLVERQEGTHVCTCVCCGADYSVARHWKKMQHSQAGETALILAGMLCTCPECERAHGLQPLGVRKVD